MSIKTPILLNFPMPITTKRLILRPIQEGDGLAIFEATEESRSCLEKWLPWPKHVKSWKDSEAYARESHANFIARKSCNLGVFKDSEFIGMCGFNYFLWDIPSAEIGYWCKTSAQKQGHTQEAVNTLVNYGFDIMSLKRIVITCLDENTNSANVAEKTGFQLEVRARGLIINHSHQDNLVMGRRYVRFNDASYKDQKTV
ncbi:MAG: GNAT family N-acetyltransferase [Alphaproteobacteria bacterium]|nr:GNAT family N-acetyltransferase [Alphaproteobacteria bacterium]